MARKGTFGTSTNPFGTGSFGGFGAYDIGGTSSSGEALRDLARYQAEVAWGNGTISDEAYLAALQTAAAGETAGTSQAVTAQNRIDDLVYRMGRQQAELAGLDALISFDQQTLGSMNPDNYRYRDIKDSLNSELARRRSRDYAIIVDAYNQGTGGSTEELLAYVQNVIASLDPEAPDAAQWRSTAVDLVERVAGEKDAQVYQDYQDKKIKPAEFLAYVQSRRDALDPDSPKWDEWDRRLTDATRNVKATIQAAKDTDFFNRYNEHKVSDKSYIKYLTQRIAGMDADDPAKAEWQHRLTEATFSLAEDLLVYEVKHGKRPVSQLIKFYEDYRTGINKGNAEYRAISDKILALKKVETSTAKGSGSGAKGSGAKGSGASLALDPKVLNAGDITSYLLFLTPNVNGPAKGRATAEAALRTNFTSLQNAQKRQDKVWLFYDPTKPGQKIKALGPDGKPEVGADGKPTGRLVEGSKYLPVSDQALADLNMVKSNYFLSEAQEALAQGKPKVYYQRITDAIEAADAARSVVARSVLSTVKARIEQIDKGIAYFRSLGEAATVLNLLFDKAAEIEKGLADLSIDETRRDQLVNAQEALGRDPLWPTGDVGPDGKLKSDRQMGGLVNIAASPRDEEGNFIPGQAVLAPGVHFSLDKTDTGGDWEVETTPPGVWAATHVTVSTTRDGNYVRGEVSVTTAPTSQKLLIKTINGEKMIDWSPPASYISWMDGNGNRVHAYSLDNGRTWLRTDGISAPLATMNGKFAMSGVVGADRSWSPLIIDTSTGATAFYMNASGQWTAESKWLATAARGLEWAGQSEAESYNILNPSAPMIGNSGVRGTMHNLTSDGSINFIAESTRLLRYQAAKADVVVRGGTGGKVLPQFRSPEQFEADEDFTVNRASAAQVKRLRDLATALSLVGRASTTSLGTMAGATGSGGILSSPILPPINLPPPVGVVTITPSPYVGFPISVTQAPPPPLPTLTSPGVQPPRLTTVSTPVGGTRTVSSGGVPAPVGKAVIYEPKPAPVRTPTPAPVVRAPVKLVNTNPTKF